MVVELGGKTAIFSRRVPAIGGVFFDPRTIIDHVFVRGQIWLGQIFDNIWRSEGQYAMSKVTCGHVLT